MAGGGAGGGGPGAGAGGGGDGDGDGMELLFCDKCTLVRRCYRWWMDQHRRSCGQEQGKRLKKVAENQAAHQAQKLEHKRAKDRKKSKAELSNKKGSASSKSTCDNKKRNP